MEQTQRDRQDPVAHWPQALRVATDFLRRWNDDVTTTLRDDLGAESAWIAVRSWERLRCKSSFPAFVRTVARRKRARAMRERRRWEAAGMDFDYEVRDQIAAPVREPEMLTVGTRRVPVPDLQRELPALMAKLRGVNAKLLLGYYGGSSCAELAEKFGLSRDGVRVRLHRSRSRLRTLFESRTKNSGAAHADAGLRQRDPQDHRTDIGG